MYGVIYISSLEYLKICLTVVTQVYSMSSIFLKHSWTKLIAKIETICFND